MTTVTDRREERRRRILEKSEERLRKILNIQNQNITEPNKSRSSFDEKNSLIKDIKDGDVSQQVNTTQNISQENSSNDQFSSVKRIITQTNLFNNELKNINSGGYIGEHSDLDQIFENDHSQQSSQTQLEFREVNAQYISKNHGFIVILAFIVRYLCLISEQYAYLVNFDLFETYLNKIFLPILLYEIMKIGYTKKVKADSNLLTTLLLLSGRQSHKIQQLVTCLNHFRCIFQDVMLYFFAFILFDLGINFVSKGDEYIV